MGVNRGDVWLIDLNPVIGHEQAGTRPALIISDNLFNHSHAEMVIVLPITSRCKHIPSHVAIELEGLKVKSYIKTEDIRAVSTRRLIRKLGTADEEIVRSVEERLALILGFRN